MRRRAARPPRIGVPDPSAARAPGILPPVRRTGRRILALHLPFLGTEVTGHPGPVLTWMTEGSRRLVVAADAAALALGIRPGATLAEATSLASGVAAIPHDPARVAARLDALALHALRLTPLVATDPSEGPPDALLLDVTGVAGLFGGEAAMAARAVAGLARLGHAAVATVAGVAPAAAALARWGVPGSLSPEEEAASVAALPVLALRVATEVVVGVRRIGLHAVGDVLAQPRGPLVRRFGAALALALDTITGAATTPFRSVRPPPDRGIAMEFLEPIITRSAIDGAADHLLHALCARLAATGEGMRRLTLRAHRADGGVQEVAIGTGLASRDPRHLSRLLSHRLESLEPRFGFDRIALLADGVEPLDASQANLVPGEAETRAALAALLDRVAQKVPTHRLRPRASHWPERAVERVAADVPEASPPGRAARVPSAPPRATSIAILPGRVVPALAGRTMPDRMTSVGITPGDAAMPPWSAPDHAAPDASPSGHVVPLRVVPTDPAAPGSITPSAAAPNGAASGCDAPSRIAPADPAARGDVAPDGATPDRVVPLRITPPDPAAHGPVAYAIPVRAAPIPVAHPLTMPGIWPARARPLHLFPRPERLEAVALLPDAPPTRLRHRRDWHPVRAAEGPERLEPEWWRDRPGRATRDYYRVELEDGRRWWICRAGAPGAPDWFLHGLLG